MGVGPTFYRGSVAALRVAAGILGLAGSLALWPPTQSQAAEISWVDQGYAAYQRNDFATAFRLFGQGAAQGDAKAMMWVGRCYDNGEGVPQNEQTAMGWYKKSAVLGDFEGQFELGQDYSCGCGGEVNLEKSVHYLTLCLPACRAAADEGQKKAENDLATLYEKGWAGLKADRALALQWYEKAADQGLSEACFNLGRLYAGVDKKQSARWFGRALEELEARADKGSASSQTAVAILYRDGLGTDKDADKAEQWREKAAASGERWSISELGLMDVVKNPRHGLALIEQAAEMGESHSALWLAEAYGKGHDLERAPTKERYWLLQAARFGNLEAQTRLAEELEKQPRFGRAVADRWRQKALEQALYYTSVGDWEWVKALIEFSADGHLSDQERDRALTRVHELAQWGDPLAQRKMEDLGWLYRLRSPWPERLFFVLFLAPILVAWAYAAHALGASRRGPMDDPGTILFDAIAVRDLCALCYLMVLLLGARALGTRVYLPYLSGPATLLALLPRSSYGLYYLLLVLGGLFVGLAGWLCLRASIYELEDSLKGTPWPVGRRYLWKLKGFAPIVLILVLAGGAVMILGKVAPAGGLENLLWLPLVLGAFLLQPYLVRQAYGMVKVADGPLAEIVGRLSSAAGVAHNGLFLWDTSESKMANAMVMGGTAVNRQVIVTSVLEANLSLREQEAVLAHELGHIKLGHLVMLPLAAACLAPLMILPGGIWAFWAGLIVVLPVLRRHLELQADAFAVKTIGEREALESALAKADRLNCVPSRFNLYHRLFGSHPSLTVRVAHLRHCCMACHARNRPGALRCGSCGASLTEASPGRVGPANG